MKSNKKKYTIKQRFQYWLDTRMSKGVLPLVKIMTIFTVLVVAVVAISVWLLTSRTINNLWTTVWDSFAYTFNGWLPFTEDKESMAGPAFLIPTAIGSIVGILFTSTLIGIISSAIEEKLTELRKGTSLVLEEGHIVVLGFIKGEYSLINQLIIAADGNPVCIVVAGGTEKDEMESLINENITLPPNVKMICRKVDITDPQSLACCSIENAKAVVVSPQTDEKTVRAIMAALKLLGDNETDYVNIIAAVSDNKYLLPKHMCKHRHILNVQTEGLLARIIARSCTQPGIANTISTVFDFEGSEFYAGNKPELAGKTFGEIMGMVRVGTPIGYIRKGETITNPGKNLKYEAEDKLIYLSENRNSIEILSRKTDIEVIEDKNIKTENKKNGLIVIGENPFYEEFMEELPNNLTSKKTVTYKEIPREEMLYDDLKDMDHVVILNSHNEKGDSDAENILTLLRVRDVKGKYNLNYSITTELKTEKSKQLVQDNDMTDYVIASDTVAKILAQYVESPELREFFVELLSKDGNVLHLRKPTEFSVDGAIHSVFAIREKLFSKGYICIGYIKDGDYVLNPDGDKEIYLDESNDLIVIGRNDIE